MKVTIDPVTRLEGHAKIEIFFDDAGDVANVYFQVPELRGFEQLCVGRLAEEMPLLTSRICGICPEAHMLASLKALDALFGVEPPPAARAIRELVYSAFFVADHTTHFYAFGGPDLLLGPDAPPAERNLFGVLRKLGAEAGQGVIECRKRNHHLIATLGGRGVHPVAGLPGGWSRAVPERERAELRAITRANVEFARRTLALFEDVVLADARFADELASDTWLHRTHSMGLVDAAGRASVFDGDVRVVDPDGVELVRYAPRDYAAHVAERVEPYTRMKVPYLRAKGWHGLVDGPDSGVYVASPLARLNAADGMATPEAQAHFERLFAHFGCLRPGGRQAPIHHRLATHWARLIELLAAAERGVELADAPELTDADVRRLPEGPPRGAGVGCVEAPRGTLTHDYECDPRGVITRCNLIVGTTNNHAAMALSIRRAAQRFLRADRVSEGLLNRVEMAFRLYDPCLSCATHAAPGAMPMTVVLRAPDGEVLHTLTRSRA